MYLILPVMWDLHGTLEQFWPIVTVN